MASHDSSDIQGSEKHEKSNDSPPQTQGAAAKPVKDSFAKKIWKKLELDPPTVMLMLKGALPPTLAIAAYQSNAFAKQYTTLGYLVAIIATLSLAIQPRAKFLQSVLFSVFFTCLGAATALLEIQCVVSARNLTVVTRTPTATGSSGGAEALQYNASACTVAAVWLFFVIYCINLIKAYRPALMICVIQFSIFVIIAGIYAPRFPNMTAGIAFVRNLLKVFLTGFAFGTGVSLFIFPMTSRMIVEKQIAGMLGLMKGSLVAHSEYMAAIGDQSRLADDHVRSATYDANVAAKAKALKGNTVALGGLFTKLKMEVPFAKRELGWGKMGPEEYSGMILRLQHLLLPIVGFSTFIDIMESLKNRKEKIGRLVDSDDTLQAVRTLELDEWEEVISMSKESVIKVRGALIGGLTHVSYVLGVASKPKVKKGDVEKDAGGLPQPGDKEFASSLKAAIDDFHTHRETAIIRWCESKGIKLPASFGENPDIVSQLRNLDNAKDSVRKAQNQQQLYLLLYVEYLIYLIGTSILSTVNYVDGKYADGILAKGHFINPGGRRLRKLVSDVVRSRDSTNEAADGEMGGTDVWVGDAFKDRKDPEHLPPTNVYEKVTNHLRAFSRVLASPESSFAFRAATATISIGILAFFRQTETFFLKERGTWALIMIAISMDTQAGRGIFGFLGRLAGTVIAMVASIALWYMGDGHPAAIIPLLYIYLVWCIWFIVKNPALAIAGMISIVTVILCIGYELQDEKIGRKLTTSNGQPFYEIYILAPYRVATVALGLAVTFIWTYFPYPVTTHSTLRKDLGATLYLMANYYSCCHTTINDRLATGSMSSENIKGTPMFKLRKARRKVFGKMIVMLSKLREHSNFTKFEPTFGGRFPKETYDELIDSIQHMFNYTNLMSFSSAAFTDDDENAPGGGTSAAASKLTSAGDRGDFSERREWLADFRKFTSDLRPTSHDITSTLCLLSASIVNSQPLPPYLRRPKPFDLARRMETVDPEILSIRHITEPCYAAFAVLEVASSLVTEEMGTVEELVKRLVGEVDFSFHVVSTQGGGGEGSEVGTLVGDDEKGKRD